jgi:hypothetical protein
MLSIDMFIEHKKLGYMCFLYNLKFGLIFTIRGTFPKKKLKIFLHSDTTIHAPIVSPYRVFEKNAV